MLLELWMSSSTFNILSIHIYKSLITVRHVWPELRLDCVIAFLTRTVHVWFDCLRRFVVKSKKAKLNSKEYLRNVTSCSLHPSPSLLIILLCWGQCKRRWSRFGVSRKHPNCWFETPVFSHQATNEDPHDASCLFRYSGSRGLTE